MTSVEVHLLAYDLFDLALQADDVASVIEPLRAELEVLPREELVRVAMALAVEGALRLPGKSGRAKLAQRIQHARLNAMWAGS